MQKAYADMHVKYANMHENMPISYICLMQHYLN